MPWRVGRVHHQTSVVPWAVLQGQSNIGPVAILEALYSQSGLQVHAVADTHTHTELGPCFMSCGTTQVDLVRSTMASLPFFESSSQDHTSGLKLKLVSQAG